MYPSKESFIFHLGMLFFAKFPSLLVLSVSVARRKGACNVISAEIINRKRSRFRFLTKMEKRETCTNESDFGILSNHSTKRERHYSFRGSFLVARYSFSSGQTTLRSFSTGNLSYEKDVGSNVKNSSTLITILRITF